jgi:four helix bundle protein
MKIKDYKELNVWNKGIEIVEKVYLLTDQFPKDEMYTLSKQMRRSAVSIPSNIAEGFVRKGTNEYRHFLYISLGSCAELETQLIISNKRRYVFGKDYEGYMDDLNHEMRMLNSLIHKL